MQTQSTNTLIVERHHAIATLRLNRPAAMNSINAELATDLLNALETLARDDQVRCVVIRGEGRAFCAGQDLKDVAVLPQASGELDLAEVVAGRYKPLVERLRTMPVPTLAAVQGIAAGAGASLALMCDIVLASTQAQFVQAFAAIGLIPDSGATWLLPRLVGRARALGLALLGDKVSAEEAQRLGLIWKCVSDEVFEETVRATAERLRSLPTKALVQTRLLLDANPTISLDQALDAEAQAQAERGRASDYREGVAAFLAKRAPTFTDR
jgi:2-(1,2-epoxy-1,2-dihydrophenyl)acetyl-CoA isomerase